MKQNVCSGIERIVRTIIGLAILSLLFFLQFPVNLIGVVGLIFIATAVFKYCPISEFLGINTCQIRQTHV